MLKTTLYLWQTFSVPWKLWLALLSFLLGLWYAWLMWSHWKRREKRAYVTQTNLLAEVDGVRRQLRQMSSSEAIPSPPPRAPAVRQKGDSGVEAAVLMQKSPFPKRKTGHGEPPKIGTAFTSKPPEADDLTALEDIDANTQTKLNQLGIYQLRQLRDLTDEEIEALQAYDPAFRQVRWNFWREQLRSEARRRRESVLPTPQEVFSKEEGAQEQPQELLSVEETQVVKEPEATRVTPAADPASMVPPSPIEQVPVHFAGQAMAHDPEFGWIYPAQPANSDDFGQLNDLKPEGVALLAKLGLYRFSQIAYLEDDELAALEAHHDVLQETDWRRWRAYFRSTGGRLEVPEAYLGQPITFSPEFGVLYREAPSDANDWSELDGVDHAVAAELNAAGIYRFSQIAGLSESQVNAWERAHPEFAWKEWSAWFKRHGTHIERPASPAKDTIRLSPRLGFVYSQRPAQSDDLTLLEGINPRLAEGLNSLGIYNFAQIARLRDHELEHLLAEIPDLHAVDWGYWRMAFRVPHVPIERPTEFSGGLAQLDPRLGWTFAEPPQSQDDLSKLQGVDAGKAAALNARGFYRFSQFAHLDDAQIAAWRLQVRESRDFPWEAWRSHFQETNGELAIVPGGMVMSPDLGAVYASRPESADDFTQLAGVSQVRADQLNQLGIYRFHQMASFDDLALHKIQMADGAYWRDYFQRTKGALVIPDRLQDAGAAVSPQLGLIYRAEPQSADDFTRLKGVSNTQMEKLNALGIYRFEQVVHWTDAEIRHLERQAPGLGSVDWKSWRRHFQDFGTELEDPTSLEGNVAFCPHLGPVFDHAPANADQLTLLQGIGENEAADLNRLGIYRFEQVAHWTDLEQTAVAELCPSVQDVPWQRWQEFFQWHGDHLTIPDAFADEPVQFSPDFGVVFQEEPPHADQLDLLDGCTAKAEEEMRALGIHTFKQIGHLDDKQITALRQYSPSLRAVGWNLWRGLYQRYGTAKSAALARLRRGVSLEFAEENHVVQDARSGVLYRRAPEKADALSEITGIDAAMESALNQRGIYTFRQLAFLRSPQLAFLRQQDERLAGIGSILARWKANGGHRRWRSWDLARSDLDLLEFHPERGPIFREVPRQMDRLSSLRGLDGVSAALLKDLGIFRFTQIASLTKQQLNTLGRTYPRLKQLDWRQIRFEASRHLGKVTAID